MYFSSFSQVFKCKVAGVMTMTFSLHDSYASSAGPDCSETSGYSVSRTCVTPKENMHILRDKLQIPSAKGLLKRLRIDSLLEKSAAQFPATLICGRAGSGKTAIAAGFGEKFKKVAWYTVESTDADWPVFSAYFSASLPAKAGFRNIFAGEVGSQADIATFLAWHASRLGSGKVDKKSLIVLDDIHHTFDAAWFDDFFNLLLHSLPPDAHLLLLCRSKPPGPLWRLRSKQMLNVIDEKIIAFNAVETEDLFDSLSISITHAQEAHRKSFGRVSKLLQFAAS